MQPIMPQPTRAFELNVSDLRYSSMDDPLIWLASQNVLATSSAWPTANLAMFLPFYVHEPRTAVKIGWSNGATVSGNLDVGIYTLGGARLVNSGATAQSGTSADQFADITDTPLQPGTYFLAMAVDNTTATFLCSVNTANVLFEIFGFRTQATAYTLPSNATFATFTGTKLPKMDVVYSTLLG